MTIEYECPSCGSHDLDNGAFEFDGLNGTQTHTPSGGHYECLNCGWSGKDVNESGDYQAMLEDKADGEREERMLAAWEQTVAMKEHNQI